MEYVIIIAVLALDQISKYIVQHAGLTSSIEVIHNFFYITYLRNTGAAWSMLSGQQVLLSLVAMAAIVFMVAYMSRAKRRKEKLTVIALALMTAGAAGNLIDRIAFRYVRDFLHFYPFGYDFPVFNVADCALTIGVILLIIAMLKGEEGESHAQ